MNCDNCNKKKPVKKVNLFTGKRGRPPIRFYCEDCIELAGDSVALSGAKPVKAFRTAQDGSEKDEPKRGRGRPATKNPTIPGFYSPALFLLTMGYQSLFEPANARNDFEFRCKGCQEKVSRLDREKHYIEHQKQLKLAA